MENRGKRDTRPDPVTAPQMQLEQRKSRALLWAIALELGALLLTVWVPIGLMMWSDGGCGL